MGPALRLAVVAAALLLLPGCEAAWPRRRRTCSTTNRDAIQSALGWLGSHASDINDHLGSGVGRRRLYLKCWNCDRRRTIKNDWVDKIQASHRRRRRGGRRRVLKVICEADHWKCQTRRRDKILKGWTMYGSSKVHLCTNNFRRRDSRDFRSILAHEVGHITRANVHRTNCMNRCDNPRFSESVEQAVKAICDSEPNYLVGDCDYEYACRRRSRRLSAFKNDTLVEDEEADLFYADEVAWGKNEESTDEDEGANAEVFEDEEGDENDADEEDDEHENDTRMEDDDEEEDGEKFEEEFLEDEADGEGHEDDKDVGADEAEEKESEPEVINVDVVEAKTAKKAKDEGAHAGAAEELEGTGASRGGGEGRDERHNFV